MEKGRKVAFLATGGTIASAQQEDGSWQACLNAQEILERIAVPEGLAVSHYDHSTINSFRMDAPYLVGLAVRLQEILIETSFDGVVVAQGTDTMEEVAWFCELVMGG